MLDANQIYAFFSQLWNDAADENDFPSKRPLLAHYTSMSTLESVLRSNEIWLSHPLYMNNLQELRFGLIEAANAFRTHEGIKEVCGGPGVRYRALSDAFEQFFHLMINEDVLDVYVTCFCEHRPDDYDGLLSMWRGYGANGDGAAIVFDTNKFPQLPTSPLVLAKVHYATTEQRRAWINMKLDQFAWLLQQCSMPESMFYLPIHSLMHRFNLFALFSKHDGFREEQEWRMVYIKDRDRDKRFENMFSYHIQNERIEPKLKFKVGQITGMESGLQLEEVIDRILLGPSTSSPIALATVKRMLSILDKNKLEGKVRASSTPYRAKG